MSLLRKQRGRPLKDRRKHLFIAATVDYRGANDDQLFFVFRGASQRLIAEAFKFLIGKGNGIAREAVITEEHDIIHRNAKGFWRIAVEIREPNFIFCALEDQKLLIEATLKRLHPCTLHWLTIEKFLNV